MKKLIVSASVISVLCLTALFGCSSTKQADKKNGEEEVTIRTASMFGGTDPGTEIYYSIMDKFIDDNPNVTIEDESNQIDERWRASIINDFYADNEPDILYFVHGADGQALVDSGNVVDIETIREEFPDFASNISDSAFNVLETKDGKSYAVPMTGYWMGVYVNETLFDAYDLELPTTWGKLMTAVETFRDNDITPFALALGHIPHFFIEHVFYAHGGVEALRERPDDPNEIPGSWLAGLDTLKELYDMGAFPKDTNSTTEDEVNLQFQNGSAAMMVNGTWFQGNIPLEDDSGDLVTQDEVTIIPFPMHPDGTGTPGVVAGWNGGFYISKQAWEDPVKRKYVIELVKAHTSTEAISRYAGPETGGVSPDESVEMPDDTDRPLVNLGNQFWVENREHFADPSADYMKSDPKNEFYQGLPHIVTGKLTAEALLKSVIEQMPFEN